jgi:hypothetical protein
MRDFRKLREEKAGRSSLGTVLAIAAGWIFAAGLCFIYCLLLAAYIVWSGLDEFSAYEDAVVRPIWSGMIFSNLLAALCVWLTGLPFVASGPVMRRRVIVFLFLCAIPLAWLAVDSRPVENDYSYDQLPVPARNAKESYACLMKFKKDGGLNLTLNAPNLGMYDSTNVLMYAGEIEQAWQDIAEGRKVIEQLNSFDEVADLHCYPDDPVVNINTIRNIAHVYWGYSLLKMAQNESEEGIKRLAELHSAMRKCMPCARFAILKMTSAAILRENVGIAHSIAEDSGCSPGALALIRKNFTPFTEREISLRPILIAEYLRQSDYLRGNLTAGFPDKWGHQLVDKPKPGPFLLPLARRILVVFSVNLNRTILCLKQGCEVQIAGAEKIPSDATAVERWCDEFKKRRHVRNFGGIFFVTTTIPSYSRCADYAKALKASADLLAIESDRRTDDAGEKGLCDPFSGKGYCRDEATGEFFSVGPDGLPDTEDDIRLGKMF